MYHSFVGLARLANIAEEQSLPAHGLNLEIQQRKLRVSARSGWQGVKVDEECDEAARGKDLLHRVVFSQRSHVVVRFKLLAWRRRGGKVGLEERSEAASSRRRTWLEVSRWRTQQGARRLRSRRHGVT